MIVLDANALMMPVECDVRVFEELERLLGDFDPTVPAAVVDELERLSSGGGEEATAASVGLDLARDRCRTVAHDADSGDNAVLECARRAEATHAVTNDMPLRRRLLDANVPVISLRGNNKLTVTQP